MPPNRSTVPPAPSRPGNARDGFACAYRRTRNRKSTSDSWDGGLVEGSWTEGYFSTGQTACGDLIGESLGQSRWRQTDGRQSLRLVKNQESALTWITNAPCRIHR